ncbi:MAG TPA: hypothetical protein ENF82_03545 [Candidatus Methanomethylia archaeon]|nr:hypothetical protein [Candidatus Methanomethylicia archaeon]
MAREDEVAGLMENYVSSGRVDCTEALYLWARGVPGEIIASSLRVRYGIGTGYSEIIKELKRLKIKGPQDRASDTETPVGKIIVDLFLEKITPILAERILSSAMTLPEEVRKLLVAMHRAGVLRGGKMVSRETVMAVYRAVHGESLDGFALENALRLLVKACIVERLEGDKVILPNYLDLVLDKLLSILRGEPVEMPEVSREELEKLFKGAGL